MPAVSARRAAWGLLLAGVVAYQVWALWLTPGGRTRLAPSDPPLEVALVHGATTAQSFRIDADGLERVTIDVSAPTLPERGRVLVDLEVREEEGWRRLFRDTVDANRAAARGRLLATFPRQPYSRHFTYRVVLRGIDIPADTPLVLPASRHAGDPAFQFWIDGQERWGDLALLAETAQATAHGRLRPLFPHWPDWAIATVLVLALLGWNVVFGLALWRAFTPEAAYASDELAEPPLAP
jgi:hypothetical protein